MGGCGVLWGGEGEGEGEGEGRWGGRPRRLQLATT